MVPEPTSDFAATITGRLAEYQEVTELIDQASGLTVLSCDPFSGTSALLRAAAGEARHPCVLVDARGCSDALDLAMSIADTAVTAFVRQAAGWWTGTAPPQSPEGLRLSRTLSASGIEVADLRLGSGKKLARLADAVELLVTVAQGRATLVIDHLGPLLLQGRARDARQLLGELRASLQRHPQLDLLLVEFPDGPAATALAEEDHPLYRAGAARRMQRAPAERFVADLFITRPKTSVPVPLLRACADIADGVPALTWRTVELAPDEPKDAAAAALSAWRALRRITEPSTARHFETLRRVHPLAQAVVCVISSGLKPHSIAANTKSVNDALRAMRGLGLAWQPEPRRWALADPLLAAHARDHAPPWVARRRAESVVPLDNDQPGET